jgi:hypothetical protein
VALTARRLRESRGRARVGRREFSHIYRERGRGEGDQGERLTSAGVRPSMAFKELLNGEERAGGGEEMEAL